MASGMRRRKISQRPEDLISASEIAGWAYCPEQFRLQYGLGLEPKNWESLAAGNRHHARKALAERVAGGAIVLGKTLVVVTLLLLEILWLV
jgi:hypothetical protein